MKPAILALALLAPIALDAAPALAQDTVRHELIYGAELMTRAERAGYREDLNRARTAEDEKKVRDQHREQIQRRAKARGVRLDQAGLVIRERSRDRVQERTQGGFK